MTALRTLLTSECGLAGHPDKVADLIGDAVLDAFLAQDAHARVGCQAMLVHGLIIVGGQVTSNASVDVERVIRRVLTEVGYEAASEGVSPDSEVLVRIEPQSPEIGAGVDRGGAGDSAIVIGYACRDTPELMPLPAHCAHAIAERIDAERREGRAPWLRPDGKVQATVAYADGGVGQLHSVVVSVQHGADMAARGSPDEFAWSIVRAAVPAQFITSETRLLSRAGVGFSVGGPKADCGLSGRKVIADTYGGAARHGGGGLSGKDPSKIDRCGMYAARYIAKNLVAAGVADRCEIQLAYVIGHPEPVAVSAECNGGAGLPPDDVVAIIRRVFPLSPPAIIERLQLRRPIYARVGTYGHFGHEGPEFTWEQCDAAGEIGRRA